MRDCRLIIFVKAARAGTVKTRLAASIGSHAACAAYEALVEAVLREVGSLENVQLRFSPDDAAGEIRRWARSSWSLVPQGGGDLGERLDAAFAAAFRSGAERVVIIGSDCPYVTETDIMHAWEALGSNDVVLGPAWDGGYWLIGLRERARPTLFENIPWGTDLVLERTLESVRTEGLRVQLLRELRDIDTIGDWHAYRAGKDLASTPSTA
jgi:uncharacterized protein